MIRYCRAYDLARLLESPDLAAAVPPDRAGGVGYVWDDYSITLNPFADEESLIDGDSSAWRRFCDDVVGFTVPADHSRPS